MNVMVTGADGFVGRNTVQYLSNYEDVDVYAATRADFDADFMAVRGNSFDVIINLASNSSVEESVNDPDGVVRENVDLLLKVLEYARKRDIKVVHLSTVEATDITNPYAGSKAAQEAVIEAYRQTYNLGVVVLRSSNIIGPAQGDEKFVPTLIRKIHDKEVIMLYQQHGETAKRTYVPVLNVANALYWLSKELYRGATYQQPLYIDDGRTMTNLEMAKYVADLQGAKLHYEFADPVNRPNYVSKLSPAGVALSSLGWEAPYTFERATAWIAQE